MFVLSALAASACACTSPPVPRAELPHPELTGSARALASAAFRGLWYDGNAELSGYRMITPRYGELRTGEMVLVYVTEPMNRRTWIKDDDATGDARVDVLKLNQSFGFLTGLYPYSVMTSVFAPIDDWGVDRFTPIKMNISAQEWCGHVFEALWPGRGRLQSQIASYFASEGEGFAEIPVPEGTLYEDALLIQLRELDGPFAGGADWSGSLVPSLWRVRRAHQPPAPTPATISRSIVGEGLAAVTRFVLNAGDYRRSFDVERAPPRRILGWTTSEGEEVKLLQTERLPYWTLNHTGDETKRAGLGLLVAPAQPRPEPPAGTRAIGR